MIPDADTIANLCYRHFNSLPKKGKPIGNEWTVLSCIVQSNIKGEDEELRVVSLGTGTRCIGFDKMSSCGQTLNDSHAEVMARRGFLRYLYQQALNAYTYSTSIFERKEDEKLELRGNIQFHLFCTHSPCGDVSNVRNNNLNSIKQSQNENLNDNGLKYEILKRRKLDDGTFVRITGARPLILKACDAEDLGLGQPSYKPGKGSPTLSMSCTDKLAKWMRVGLQGALLSLILIDPVYLHSIVIAETGYLSKESFYRGLIDRKFVGLYENHWEYVDPSTLPVVPVLLHSQLPFKHSKDIRTEPCPNSVVWCSVSKEQHQVAVNGQKLGATKNDANKLSSSLKISKYHLFLTFMTVSRFVPSLRNIEKDVSYKCVKKFSVNYYNRWNDIKTFFFNLWTDKPDCYDFTL